MLDNDMRFKEALKRLDEKFPDRELLRIIDVVEFCGLPRSTVRNMFPFTQKHISKVKLAKELSI